MLDLPMKKAVSMLKPPGSRRVLIHTSILSPCGNLECTEEELLTVFVSGKHLCSSS